MCADVASRSTCELPGLAVDLVRRNVAVLAALNTPSILAAKAATKTIPIVFGTGVDPIKLGLVESLNHLGGNVTGVTQLNIEMEAKRVHFLHELAPSVGTIALLINPSNPAFSEAATASAKSAAQLLGLNLWVLAASNPGELDAAFATLAEQRLRLLLVSADPFFVAQREQLVTELCRALYGRQRIFDRQVGLSMPGSVASSPNIRELLHSSIGFGCARVENPAGDWTHFHELTVRAQR